MWTFCKLGFITVNNDASKKGNDLQNVNVMEQQTAARMLL